jgi:CubicO group peptidase (beta-lactamase class C family)
MKQKHIQILMCTLLLCISPIANSQQPRYVDPALDDSNLPSGDPSSVLGDSGDSQIIRFRNWWRLYPGRVINAGDSAQILPRNPADFSRLSYEVEGEQFSLDEYKIRNHVGGLLVIKDGVIRHEFYGMGNDEETRWISFSMSKSVTSMLLGAAIHDGYIESVDDKVTDYLPLLEGSSYDQASLRHVLQMSSGVAWNEDYTDMNSDVATYPAMDLVAMMRYLGNKERVAAPGTVFNYNTAETDLVGAIVRAAIGNNLASYLEYKIWQPFGMEADAVWSTHGPAGERGGCCLNVTLRDYGRIGLFALADGVLPDGTRVLPEGWIEESTTPSPGSDGYGYLWWLSEDGEGNPTYDARGIFGQGIHINPRTNLVIVVLSAWTHAAAGGTESQAHRVAMYNAIDRALAN